MNARTTKLRTSEMQGVTPLQCWLLNDIKNPEVIKSSFRSWSHDVNAGIKFWILLHLCPAGYRTEDHELSNYY